MTSSIYQSLKKEIRKQMLTGRTCNGENISLKVSIINKQVYNEGNVIQLLYKNKILITS